eukprot:3043642-Pyramimonas_sp.AAC.1
MANFSVSEAPRGPSGRGAAASAQLADRLKAKKRDDAGGEHVATDGGDFGKDGNACGGGAGSGSQDASAPTA